MFLMLSVGVPWPLNRSTTERVEEVSADIDSLFVNIGVNIRAVWPGAHCATSEFWETEVRFPAGMYIPTDKGLVRSDWWPEEVEEGTTEALSRRPTPIGSASDVGMKERAGHVLSRPY